MGILRRRRRLELHHRIPSLNLTLSDCVILLMAAAVLAWGVRARLSADYASVAPPFVQRSPLVDPLAPDQDAPFSRPLASFLIRSLPGAMDEIPAEYNVARGDQSDSARDKMRASQRFALEKRQLFARSLHFATMAALGVALLGTFVWLKFLLRRGLYATLPASAVLLLAASPLLAGQSGSVLAFSEILSLAFAAWALTFYSVNPYGEPAVLWSLAPIIWLLSCCAMASSETALGLPIFFVLVDAAAYERGSRLKRVVEHRLLTAYVPMGLLVAGFAFLGGAPGHFRQIAQTAAERVSANAALLGAAFVDPFEFAALGRYPDVALAGLLWPIVLGGALALALMFLFTRLRLASMWLAAFAASMALLALAGQGTPVLSPGLLIYPAYFLTLCVATLAIGLGGQKVRVPGVRWRLPAFLAMAVLAGASFYAQQRRMTARLDAGDLLSAAAPARPTLPEVAYMASEARLAEAIAGADVEARREMVREADALWEQAINSYLDTRERLPRAPAPHLPESLFGEWVEKLLRENKLPEALDFLRDMARLEPQNPAHRLQLAFLLATSGEMDEAAQIMRGALKEARSTKSASALAKSPEHKFMLAFLLFRVGEVQEGEKLLREVAATVEDAADLGVRMAERVARTSGDEAAVRFATAFIEKGNLGPQPLARAMYERGRILSRMPGREAEARRDLESALSHPDLRDRARALLARVSLETGDYARVRELSRQPGEPQSIPDFEAVMGLNIAQALQTGRQEKAREWLDGWVETAASGQPKARAYMERAHVADQANRQADALRDFRAAVAEAPSFAPASRGLADFLLRNKFYDEAEQVLRDGFSRAGEDMAMLAVYAELMIALGKAQTALPVLESHLQSRKGPDRPEPHYWLGRVYSALELWPLAIDRYKKTLELAPDHKDAKLYLATALQKTPEFERGAELLVELIGQDPANEDLYGRLAELYRVNADLESAALAISKGLHNTGNRSATLYIKGAEIALDANRLDVAEKSARQAIALEAPGSRLRAKAEQLLQKTLDAKARAESVAQLQAQAEEKK